MGKETLLIVGIIVFLQVNLVAQEKPFEPSGQVYGKVFSNVHGGLLGDDHSSAFEITQAYFGYKYNLSEEFSSEIKLDIGDPVEASYSKLKRYAYFKLAQLKYQRNNFTFRFGIIGMQQFKIQEKFWTRKYVKKTYQDYYKFGPSADIGTAIAYQFSSKLKVEGLLMNGEGYKDLQNDDTYKGGLAITFKPVKSLILFAYTDAAKKGNWTNSYAFFTGYQYKKLSIGAEYNMQTNVDYVNSKNWAGISAYASYKLCDRWELFARYDQLSSTKLEDDAQAWNAATEIEPYPQSDGQYLIGGLQFQPIKKVKVAFDGQYYIPEIQNDKHQLFGFVHFQYEL